MKDILKGTLKFACGFEEEEIIISDNHFQEEEEEQQAAMATSVKHHDQSEETFLDNDPLLGSVGGSQHQSQSAMSSNTNVNGSGAGGDDSDTLLTFESHFNECNNVERTAAMESSSREQNGHAHQTGIGAEENGRTPSDIDNDNSELLN